MTTLAPGHAVTAPMAPAVTSEPLHLSVSPVSPVSPASPVDVRPAYREAMGTLAGGVCVITTLDGVSPTGLTVTTGFSVSMDPPIFGVCVDNGSRTLPALLERGAFVANVLGGASAHVASSFASKSEDKFVTGSGPITRGTTSAGLPWLPEDCVRAVECEISRVIAAGDHTLVLGTVAAVHVPVVEQEDSLGYLARTFHALPTRPAS